MKREKSARQGKCPPKPHGSSLFDLMGRQSWSAWLASHSTPSAPRQSLPLPPQAKTPLWADVRRGSQALSCPDGSKQNISLGRVPVPYRAREGARGAGPADSAGRKDSALFLKAYMAGCSQMQLPRTVERGSGQLGSI